MTVHLETELKLKLVEPACWERLLASPLLASLGGVGPLTSEVLEAQYFDTPSHGLQKARLAYRIRLEGGSWLATLKAGGNSGGGLHCREEYTVVLTDSMVPSTEPFLATPVGERLQVALNGELLEPLFITRFTRYKQDLTPSDGGRVEMAVDIGKILVGEKQAPIAELELELKEGSPAIVLAIGSALAQAFPLMVESRSKFFRGLELAGWVNNDAVGDEARPLPGARSNEPTATVLQRLLIADIIEVFSLQEDFLKATDDPEPLHRLRIALRRLRSALSFAKPLLASPEYEVHQEALRCWSHASAAARELDVAAEAWQELLTSGSVTFSGRAWLGEVLATERSQALEKFHRPLAVGYSTPLLLDLWSWLVGGAFIKSEQEIPLKEFTRVRLHSWLQELLSAGDELDLVDIGKLHTLRIRGKKLRYMLNTLSDFSGGGTEKLINSLKRLQGQLGYRRDVNLTAALLNGWLQARSSRALHRDAGLLMGWEAHAIYGKQDGLLRDWKRFRKAARHWAEGKGARET